MWLPLGILLLGVFLHVLNRSLAIWFIGRCPEELLIAHTIEDVKAEVKTGFLLHELLSPRRQQAFLWRVATRAKVLPRWVSLVHLLSFWIRIVGLGLVVNEALILWLGWKPQTASWVAALIVALVWYRLR